MLPAAICDQKLLVSVSYMTTLLLNRAPVLPKVMSVASNTTAELVRGQ